MYRIFIVEDDAAIADTVSQYLTSQGFCTRCAAHFQDIMDEFRAFQPHLVLLDLSLPFFNGYHWCEQIRSISTLPIIILSSAADNLNLVMAVTAGGDDYIAKPFDLSVLLAKVQALLRRCYDFPQQAFTVEYHGLVLNWKAGTLTYHDQKTELSKNENKILSMLLTHPGVVVSREELMNALWETDSFIDENTLTVNIMRLRKKLNAMGIPPFIQTKKGMGYLIP